MTLSTWPARRWLAAAAGTALTLLVIGVPTGIVRTALYTRMTPVLWWNYPIWLATATLGGLILATYVRTPETRQAMTGPSAGGGLLSVLAVGCPVCNKLVVALIGVSGALTVWAPIQPLLGIASLALLGFALRRRLAVERACRVTATA